MKMKNVIISIKGTQNGEGGENDAIELVTDGLFRHENGKSSFSYMESEITGMDGTKTSFNIGDEGYITMSREGSVSSHMVFEEGKKHNFIYDTPFGSTMMGVNTRKVVANFNEHGGNLEIDYLVDYQQAVVGHNRFKIKVREQKEDV